jgi:CheY-like chemotaxis protein
VARRDDIKNLIQNYDRRLQKLKEQKALAGRSVDPAILIEIEDIEAELRDLTMELAIIESRTPLAYQTYESLSQDPSEKARQIPTILVIDDEPAFLEILSLTLETAGYQVFTARNGIEALAVLQRQPVDLILSDISMPHMNGYQFYHRLCENAHWIKIPFIFLTAHGMDSDINYGKELGVDDYLSKPIRAQNLLSVVRGKLRRQAAIVTIDRKPASNFSDSLNLILI